MQRKRFSHYTPAVYMLLLHRQAKRQDFPKVEEIAGIIGVSLRTVARCLSELKEAGYLTAERRCRESNLYTVRRAGKNSGLKQNT